MRPLGLEGCRGCARRRWVAGQRLRAHLSSLQRRPSHQPEKRPRKAAFPGASQGPGGGERQGAHPSGLWRADLHSAWVGPRALGHHLSGAWTCLHARTPRNQGSPCLLKTRSLEILACEGLKVPSEDPGYFAGVTPSMSGGGTHAVPDDLPPPKI